MELTLTHDNPIRMIERQTWDPMDVRDLCIRHNWYNAGTNTAYSDMLDLVAGLEPTPSNMMRVAQNIENHTNADDGQADNIMFHIANEVVMRFFEF